MTLYDDFQTTARDLLTEFKQGVAVLVVRTPSGGTPSAPTFTETEVPLTATSSGVPVYMVNGTSILATDLLVLAAVVAGTTPKVGDVIKMDGKRYAIVRYLPIPPKGTTVVWRFVVRA